MLYLTREQVREVDRRAMEEYGLPGIVLMENASRGASEEALRMLGERRAANVVCLCGGGNNGGDGLAMARHLHNHGHAVSVFLCTDAGRYRGDARINWEIVQRMRLTVRELDCDTLKRLEADLIVDAIFGTGLSQAPRPPFKQIAAAVAQCGAPVLAVDVPSGLDCDTGRTLGACIRATRTVTFAAMKAGFANPQSHAWTGPIRVADIGCPRQLVVDCAR